MRLDFSGYPSVSAANEFGTGFSLSNPEAPSLPRAHGPFKRSALLLEQYSYDITGDVF